MRAVKFINLNKTDVNEALRLLNPIIFIGQNLVHIFAAQGKIYTSLDLKKWKVKQLKSSVLTAQF